MGGKKQKQNKTQNQKNNQFQSLPQMSLTYPMTTLLTFVCYEGKLGTLTSSTDLEASIFLTFPISSYKSIIGFVD